MPPARFSPLATTRSTARASRSGGTSCSTASRPGLPMTSPIIRTRTEPRSGWSGIGRRRSPAMTWITAQRYAKRRQGAGSGGHTEKRPGFLGRGVFSCMQAAQIRHAEALLADHVAGRDEARRVALALGQQLTGLAHDLQEAITLELDGLG